MTVHTSAGSTLTVSVAAPVTFDVSGYDTLFGLTAAKEIGEITDAGEFGREYNLVSHNPLGDRGTKKFKGSFNEGQMALQLGLDDDDAGQLIMQAASISDADHYFMVTTQDGTRYFFAAKVMSWKVGIGSVDSITTATSTLEITTVTGGIGILKDPAP